MDGEPAVADDDNSVVSVAAKSEDDDDNSIVKSVVLSVESEKTANGAVSSPSKESKEELSTSSPTTETKDGGPDTKQQVTFKEQDNVNVKVASALKTVEELRPTGNREFLAALHAAAVLLEEEGRYDEALSFFEEGLERKSKVYGDQHRLTLEEMNSLASCLAIVKRFDEAEIHLNKCIENATSEYGANDSMVLSARINLGSLYRNTNRNEEAARCFDDTIDKYRQNCAARDDGEGDLNAETLVAMSLLASTLEILKQYDRAANLHQEILMVAQQGTKKILGEEYAVFLTSVMNSLAYEQRMLGNDSESEAMYRRCLEKREQTVGKNHADYLNTLQNLAVLLSTMNKFEEAETLFREVIDGRQRLYGDGGVPTMESKSFLGIMLSNAGKFEESLDMFADCFKGQRAALGSDDKVTLASLMNLASSLENLHRYSEAVPLYSEAVRGMRQTLGDDHDSTLIAMHCLGYCYQRMCSEEGDEWREPGSGSGVTSADSHLKDKVRHNAQAKELYMECLSRRRQVSGDESEAMLKTLHQLATVLSDNEELDASEALFVECVEKRKRVCGEDSQPYLASLSGLAHVYTKKKEHGQALRLMEECLEQRVKVLGENHLITISTMSNVAACVRRMGGARLSPEQLDRAMSLYQSVLERRIQQLGRSHPHTLNTLYCMGSLLDKAGRYADAEPLLAECLNGRRVLPRTTVHAGQAMQRAGVAKATNSNFDDDGDTREALTALAGCLAHMKRFESALPLLEEALEGQRKAVAMREGAIGMEVVVQGQELGPDLGGSEVVVAIAIPPLDSTDETKNANAADVNNNNDDNAVVKEPIVPQQSMDKGASDENKDSPQPTEQPSMVKEIPAATENDKTTSSSSPLLLSTPPPDKELCQLRENLLQTIHNLAAVNSHLGRIQHAAILYEESLAGRKLHYGVYHKETLATANNLAVVFDKLNEPRKALNNYLLILEGKRLALARGEIEHGVVITAALLVAIRFANLGDYLLAKPLFEEVVAARKASLGDDDPQTLASINSLASCYSNLKDHTKALPLYLDVLAKRRAHLGEDYDLSPDNPNPEPGVAMLTTVTNLALCYDTMGEHDRAEPLYQESLEGRRQLLGEMHPSTLSSLHNAAIYYRNQNENEVAEEYFIELLEKRKQVHGVDHDNTLSTMQSLISLYQRTKRPKLAIKAEAIFQEYFDLMTKKYGREDKKAMEGMKWLEKVQLCV